MRGGRLLSRFLHEIPEIFAAGHCIGASADSCAGAAAPCGGTLSARGWRAARQQLGAPPPASAAAPPRAARAFSSAPCGGGLPTSIRDVLVAAVHGRGSEVAAVLEQHSKVSGQGPPGCFSSLAGLTAAALRVSPTRLRGLLPRPAAAAAGACLWPPRPPRLIPAPPCPPLGPTRARATTPPWRQSWCFSLKLRRRCRSCSRSATVRASTAAPRGRRWGSAAPLPAAPPGTPARGVEAGSFGRAACADPGSSSCLRASPSLTPVRWPPAARRHWDARGAVRRRHQHRGPRGGAGAGFRMP
jgi:hypothetical protein